MAVSDVGDPALAERLVQFALDLLRTEPVHRLHALVGAYVDFIGEQPHLQDLVYGPLVAKADHLEAELVRHPARPSTGPRVLVRRSDRPSGATRLRRACPAWDTAV